MRYKPREVFREFHTSNWHRACIVAARRTGKTFAAVAELLKRSYNGPSDGQYLFISPLAEQSMANTIGMFQRFDDEGYMVRFDKTNGVITLANGAQITLGGARAAEKYRGRYLDGCFSGDTEVLTNRGWIRFDKAVDCPDIKYAQFDEETGKISFTYPLKRFEFEDREVMEVDFGVKCGNIVCTPNHKWLVKDARTCNWKKVETQNLNGHHSVPRAALNYDESVRLTPYQRLAIAVQADAHIVSRAKNTYTYRIAFNKERKIIRFIHILKDCGINARAVLQKRGYTGFYFTLPKSLNITKRLDSYFDLETVPACDFMQEIAEWDGSRFDNDGIYYSSIVKENRDFVQAVAILAGYRTAATKQVDNRKDSYSDVYRLFCTTNSFPKSGITKGKKILAKHQTVYCVEVPKHNIVVRTTRGSAVITSNCIVDEVSQVPAETISEVILPCLADRDGWLAYLGTARADDGFRLYRIYKEYENDPKWFTRMISVYQNTDGFTPERIQEIHDETLRFCLANGKTRAQAEQTFNVEFACDFSFSDEGKPMTTALFYQELQNLFDSTPSRILDPLDKEVVGLSSANKIAVFDISHSAGRDYTVTTIVAETATSPIVTNILWERDKPWQFWFDYLHQQGIRTVALPFDSAAVNKETMLSLNQTFKRNGFNVIRIKRLLREEQIESGRWGLNNCRFTRDCIPGLSEIGRFVQFSNKHGLEQDVVASFLYTGQVLQKKHTKLEIAERIQKNYTENHGAYDTGVYLYNGEITGV
jgi:hypothetical protein